MSVSPDASKMIKIAGNAQDLKAQDLKAQNIKVVTEEVEEEIPEPVAVLSPIKNTAPGITFYEAIKAVMEGKKVSRAEWKNNEPMYMKDEVLSIDMNGDTHSLILRAVDITAQDWYVL